jgi:hypothetical protein
VAKGQATLSQKAAACTGINVGAFSATTCHQDEASCSSNDLALINQTWDCLEKLPTCAPASQTSWQSQYAQCQTTTSVSTLTCADAFTFH